MDMGSSFILINRGPRSEENSSFIAPLQDGERMDDADYIPDDERVPEFKIDTPLTEIGKKSAKEAGVRITKMIDTQGYS